MFRFMDEIEYAMCLSLNRFSDWHGIRRLFSWVSRLGDGVFWYTLTLVLPVIYGMQAVPAALHMATVGAAGLLVYKLLKGTMVRQRPYLTHPGIRRGVPPLDLYSFPSGHTLHAVSFSVVATWYHPELAWLVAPFAVLVALSRMVLGLHYPSDVLVGAAIGFTLGYASIALW